MRTHKKFTYNPNNNNNSAINVNVNDENPQSDINVVYPKTDDEVSETEKDDEIGTEMNISEEAVRVNHENPQISGLRLTITPDEIRKSDVISYNLPESGEEEIATVISRAGKKTGQYSHFWNVKVMSTGVGTPDGIWFFEGPCKQPRECF